MAMIAKLVPPHMDKHHSFQVVNISKDDRDTILSMFRKPSVEKARPFLQGDSRGWVMVEFWSKDEEAIKAASDALAKSIGIESYGVGQFTRKELGLE
ncbi:hypothetical protein [Pseudomonas putida]|uniref:Uncharacterized protein n=1 Tax=Pseudomonas putida TaxID=303 RepID=A0A8I1JJ72_PSEPU|nr:hypothetical protein [Pseudomonas putida]MBI6885757.1 hypothetical protein [Pseudomonas putida]